MPRAGVCASSRSSPQLPDTPPKRPQSTMTQHRAGVTTQHTHTRTHTCTHMHACTHTRTCTHMHACTYAHTCTHAHTHTHSRHRGRCALSKRQGWREGQRRAGARPWIDRMSAGHLQHGLSRGMGWGCKMHSGHKDLVQSKEQEISYF